MNQQRFTLDDVFAQFTKLMEITNARPLGWQNDPNATVGEIIGWRKDTIWVRSSNASEQTVSGVMRVAHLEFTSNQELHLDQYNCPAICTLIGTEVVNDGKQLFTFELLPRGKREPVQITNTSDFLIIGKILTLFHSVWGSFKLGERAPVSQ